MKACLNPTAPAALAVAALLVAYHRDTPRARVSAAMPALATLAAQYDARESPGGDATEGNHQEQLEQADAVRARIAAIDAATTLDAARRHALAVERRELVELLAEIEDASKG